MNFHLIIHQNGHFWLAGIVNNFQPNIYFISDWKCVIGKTFVLVGYHLCNVYKALQMFSNFVFVFLGKLNFWNRISVDNIKKSMTSVASKINLYSETKNLVGKNGVILKTGIYAYFNVV